MQITLVVGEQARQLHAESNAAANSWHVNAADDTRSLAPDEQALLDELTRLCRRILIEDALPYPHD
jgi:hypothetical protein